MGLFRTNNPTGCGIVELDENSTVTSFFEKPANPKSDLANAGIYLTSGSLFDNLPEFETNPDHVVDIGFHLLPKLVNRMKGYPIPEFLLDVGTIDNLNFANNYVKANPVLFR